jgi:hypothetical protein
MFFAYKLTSPPYASSYLRMQVKYPQVFRHSCFKKPNSLSSSCRANTMFSTWEQIMNLKTEKHKTNRKDSGDFLVRCTSSKYLTYKVHLCLFGTVSEQHTTECSSAQCSNATCTVHEATLLLDFSAYTGQQPSCYRGPHWLITPFLGTAGKLLTISWSVIETVFFNLIAYLTFTLKLSLRQTKCS